MPAINPHQPLRHAHCPAPRSSRRRRQEAPSAGRSSRYQPMRRQSWAGMTSEEILARYTQGKAAPLKVLDVLIELFNTLHTALEKTVSHKTRHERAQFLRRFFRDLKLKAGFKTMPDPRNLGQKHIRAMVGVWQRERLAPALLSARRRTHLRVISGLTYVGCAGSRTRGLGRQGGRAPGAAARSASGRRAGRCARAGADGGAGPG